jgi:hypothetical protein
MHTEYTPGDFLVLALLLSLLEGNCQIPALVTPFGLESALPGRRI